MTSDNVLVLEGRESSQEQLYRTLVNQYLIDEVGKQLWQDYGDTLDALKSADIQPIMVNLFARGACVDFANAIFDQTGWPIYEFQWGAAMQDDPEDCDILEGVHRVILHPSGRFFDATGWVDAESVFKAFCAEDKSYKWVGEVDYGATVFDGVDYELVKKVAMLLVPEDSLKADELIGESMADIIGSLVRAWESDGLKPHEINNGLCADFANALIDRMPAAKVHGIYDEIDIETCPGAHSDEFKDAVKKGDIGHTAVFSEGLFYDAEAVCGVPRFEDLPVNRRAMGESILNDLDLSAIEALPAATQLTHGR